MQSNYSTGVKRVLTLAEECASRNNRHHVHTEHLLMGLLIERNSATNLLKSLGRDRRTLQEICQKRIEPGKRPVKDKPKLSPRVLHILSVAVEQKEAYRDKEVETRHLLLAILMEEQGGAYDILAENGITAEMVRHSLASDGERLSGRSKSSSNRPAWQFWKPT